MGLLPYNIGGANEHSGGGGGGRLRPILHRSNFYCKYEQ